MTQPTYIYPYVDDPDGAIAAGYTAVRVYSDTSLTGSFSTLVGSATLVAGTRTYTITDSAGIVGTVYRTTLYGSSPGETGLSPLIPADQVTMLQIMLLANRRTGGGWDSSASSNGSNSSLIDATLIDTARDTSFGEGFWIWRYAAASAQKIRRVGKKSYTVATGAFAPSRAWTDGGPQSGEAYAVFHYFPPFDVAGESYSWAQAVRDGIRQFVQRPLMNLGVGDGVKTRWDLTAYGVRDQDDVANLFRRRFYDGTNYRDYDASKEGRYWEIQQERPGVISVRVFPALDDSTYLMIEAEIPFAVPYLQTDVTDCPLEVAIQATRWAIYHQLNSYVRPGKYAVEEQQAWADALAIAQESGAFPTTNVLGD